LWRWLAMTNYFRLQVDNIARIMGLDIGDSRIGVALSDPLGIMASPHTIIKRDDEAAAIKKIAAIISEREVVKVIAGLPLNMDGSRGEQAQKTDVFIRALRRAVTVPVAYQDERLSTVTARELIREVRKTNRATRYDAAAAALILQSYLDEESRRKELPEEPGPP
jgi:putative Holliday junction resolvase